MPPTDTCAESHNDLTGLSVNHIAIDQSTDYDITGNGITLGAGGITATTSGSSSPHPELDLPIALGAPQTWTFEGPTGGTQDAGLGGSITGPGEALGVTLGGFQSLGLTADDEVGPVTITGANPSHSGPTAELNGSVLNGGGGSHPAKLNGTDGNPVSVTDATFAGYNDTVGPLTTNGAYVDTGAPEVPAGTLAVNGNATFDSGSVVGFIIADDTGATSGTDNSELTATGDIALGAAQISLAILGAINTACPTLPSGSVYTLVSTSGSISGTFAGVPDGTEIQLGNINCNGPPSQKLRINYHETGSPQTVTATVPGAGGVPKSTSPPTISGTALEGQTLTEAHGAWNPSPTSYSYQWESCEASGGACSPIAGATSQTYMLAAAQVCHTIRVQETASDAAGPGTPVSSADSGLVSALGSNFTWTGVGESGHWSTPGDWSGCAAPSGTVGTLTFPAGGCTMIRLCRVEDDIAGLTAVRLELPVQFTLATPGQFVITGTKALTLTSGLTTTFQNALPSENEPFEGASIATPIALGGPNTWRIATFTSVSGGVSGASHALAIDMEPPIGDNEFYLEGASNEVGPITINDWQQDCCYVVGWDRVNVTHDLNGTDGHPVTVNRGASLGGITAFGTLATVGPITVNGGGAVEAGLAVQGALDLESGASFALVLPFGATVASTPQITSTGKMSVNGAYLALSVDCNYTPGTRFTLLDAAGGLSGTLTDALTGLSLPDGAITKGLEGCTQGSTVQIHYTADTVTATVVAPPTVQTATASNVSQTTASLNGSVNPNALPVSDCHFDYGVTTSYSESVPCTQAVGSGASPVAVSAQLSGLSAGTTYHFRLVATNAAGTDTGVDATFTTSTAGGGASGAGAALAGCTAATQAPNVLAQGIEVIQATQTVDPADPGHPPEVGEGCYTAPGFAGVHPGALYPSGALFNPDGTVNHVALVAGHKTVVRVYADAQGLAGSTSPVDARLYVYRHTGGAGPGSGSDALVGSTASDPLLPDAGPRQLSPGPLAVGYTERTTPNQAYEFTLPTAWTTGTITLVAEINPPDGRALSECSTCAADDVFGLGDVSFTTTNGLYIRAGALPISGVDLRPPEAAFSELHSVLPIADASLHYPVGGYDAVIGPFPPGGACGFAGPLLQNLFNWNPPFPDTPDLERIMFITTDACGGTYPPAEFKPNPLILDPLDVRSIADPTEPLTSVAHELIHSLGFPHAGNNCQPPPSGEPWPPDQMGELDGIGLDVNSPSGALRLGGVTVGLYHRIIAPPANPSSFGDLDYDLMSYCLTYVAPANSPNHAQLWEQHTWISPRMWDQLVLQLRQGDYLLPGSPGSPDTLREPARLLGNHGLIQRPRYARAATAPSPQLSVEAVIGATAAATQITSVSATPPPSQGGVTAPGYELVARDRHQQVLARAPMTSVTTEAEFAAPVESVEGSVPAPGVAAVQIVHDGILAAERKRPAHAPSVTLLSPHRGARVGCRSAKTSRCTVPVRWRIANPEHAPVTVAIDYSANDGRSWQTVAVEPERDSARLPSRLLSSATRGRLRVRVSDGFDEGSAVSGAFRSTGAPPSVAVISPRPGEAIAAGAVADLEATAVDDSENAITGRRVRWYANRKSLGSGSTISAQLPAGTVRVTVVASDAHGRKTSRSVALRVLAQPPNFLELSYPHVLASSARKVALTVVASIPSELTVSGDGASPIRVPVRRQRRRVIIDIKPNHRLMNLTLTLSAGRERTRTTIAVKR